MKFQAKIVLLKIIGEKIGLAMNSSQGSREGAECVLIKTEPENETLITCDT